VPVPQGVAAAGGTRLGHVSRMWRHLRGVAGGAHGISRVRQAKPVEALRRLPQGRLCSGCSLWRCRLRASASSSISVGRKYSKSNGLLKASQEITSTSTA
jgi:hypothetical protein